MIMKLKLKLVNYKIFFQKKKWNFNYSYFSLNKEDNAIKNWLFCYVIILKFRWKKNDNLLKFNEHCFKIKNKGKLKLLLKD